jgi:hypothetical protein
LEVRLEGRNGTVEPRQENDTSTMVPRAETAGKTP